jgi:1-acyl-sn-glycerol-3-phosphate acyltransferase
VTPDPGGSGVLLPDPGLRYSAFLQKGFAGYLRWYLPRHFHAVRISLGGLPHVPVGRPLIIYSNHPSWWDPLLFVLIGTALFPGRRGFGPMEARALKRYAILERLGAFGIDLDSARGGVEFMVQGRRILAAPGSILWLTAEGAFTDVRQRPVKIRQGLGYLARMVPDALVLPLAVEYPFWNESRPEALCRFGAPIDVRPSGAAGRSAAAWNDVFEHALSHTMDQLAGDALQRNPARFRALLEGSSGVGGIYDGWRRVRAWSRGRRFDPSHEPQP